jgi:ribosomal protein S18 acetylase RimI-like enzyme
MAEFHIRPLDSSDKDWVRHLIAERWGAEFVVAHDTIFHPHDLPGFVAVQGAEKIGLITFSIAGDSCEIVTLDSLRPSIGIGAALIEAAKTVARQAHCKRVWLITTNDNLNALRFYQKRGFVLVAVHRNAMEVTRQLKPIPLIGEFGIPLRDEIELELMLKD